MGLFPVLLQRGGEGSWHGTEKAFTIPIHGLVADVENRSVFLEVIQKSCSF